MVSLDWIKMGWGKDLSQTPSPVLSFVMDFSAAVETEVLPVDAAVQSVKRIAEKYPAPFTLMVSGGIDSQAMLQAWVKSGVPFKALSIVYVDEEGNPFNLHDLDTLPFVAGKLGVPIEYRTLKLIQFIEFELEDYVLKHRCTSPQICTHMKMSEMIEDGTVVFSGNFFTGGANLDYTVLGLHRYTVNSGRSIIPFFFIHDPELVGACHKLCKAVWKNFEDVVPYQRKVDIYRIGGFDVTPQTSKLTGFEMVKKYYDKKPELVTLRDRLEFAKYPSRHVFDIVFRYRFTRKVKYAENIINLPPRGMNENPNRF